MLIVFGCLVAAAFVMLLKRTSGESGADPDDFTFNAPLSGVIGSSVGLLSGIVGAGGGFILIPAMTTLLRIPMRVAVGSSLGIVFIGSLMGALGKVLSLQVKPLYLLPVLLGSIPSAQLGARVSKRLSPIRLRYALLGVVFLALVKTWTDILLGG